MGKGEEPRPKFTLYVHTQADTHTHTHADSRKKRGGAEPKFTSYVHTWKHVEVGLMGGGREGGRGGPVAETTEEDRPQKREKYHTQPAADGDQVSPRGCEIGGGGGVGGNRMRKREIGIDCTVRVYQERLRTTAILGDGGHIVSPCSGVGWAGLGTANDSAVSWGG